MVRLRHVAGHAREAYREDYIVHANGGDFTSKHTRQQTPQSDVDGHNGHVWDVGSQAASQPVRPAGETAVTTVRGVRVFVSSHPCRFGVRYPLSHQIRVFFDVMMTMRKHTTIHIV